MKINKVVDITPIISAEHWDQLRRKVVPKSRKIKKPRLLSNLNGPYDLKLSSVKLGQTELPIFLNVSKTPITLKKGYKMLLE